MPDQYSDHQSASLMSEAPPAPPASSGAWKLQAVSARKAENGGVIVTCSKTRQTDGPSSFETKDYAFGSVDEALAYIGQELGQSVGSGGGIAPVQAPALS